MDLPPPIVIVGPSGVGKSVLIKKLKDIFPDKFGFCVSHTTRDPRPGEQDGKDYHFLAHAEMEKAIAEGSFIEHAHVHGNIYGTSKDAVDAVRKEGKVCILDIDVQGAKSIQEQQAWSDTKFVFINPPSMEELESRLRGRGTETEEKVLKRLANAKGEMEFSKQVSFFDYNFVFERMGPDEMPRGVVELVRLLTTWYPCLGQLPDDLRVLRHFQEADQSSTGLIARSVIAHVLLQCGSFTDAELRQLLDPVSNAQDRVEYQKLLAYLFQGIAVA